MGEQFSVQVLTRREQLGALRGPWDVLWQRCPEATTFQRPEWLLPWCRELGPEEVLVLSCWSERELVGLAPLAIHHLGAERVVALLGAGISDYNDVLAAPGAEVAVAEAVFACLLERADAWDLADFGDLPGSSPLLAAEAPRGWSDEVEQHEACPRVILPEGASPDRLFPPEIRARLGRARRRLARAGAVRVDVASEEHVDELLDALFANHRARWEARGTGGVLGERLWPFHREVAHGLAARGALRLFGLRLDGRIIASLYGLAERDGLASYITGFDPALAWYSPGLVMLASAIEHAAAEGARFVDFLRGREPYKYEWGAVDRWTYRRRLRHERAGGSARVGEVEERAGAVEEGGRGGGARGRGGEGRARRLRRALRALRGGARRGRLAR